MKHWSVSLAIYLVCFSSLQKLVIQNVLKLLKCFIFNILFIVPNTGFIMSYKNLYIYIIHAYILLLKLDHQAPPSKAKGKKKTSFTLSNLCYPRAIEPKNMIKN